MSQSEVARTREPGTETGDNQTPKRLDSNDLLQNEPESGERLSTRDTTDKIDSRGKDNQQSAAKLENAGAQDGRMDEEVEVEDPKNQAQQQDAMLLEDLPQVIAETQDQMLKEQLFSEPKTLEDPSKDFFSAPGMQVGMKKKPGRPPLKREPGLVGPSAKTKSYSGGGGSSGKHAKGKRAGTVREQAYDGSHAAKPSHSAPSRSRKDYMTYEEMIASVNLLRYLDWEKLNPKSHQNSPRKLDADLVNNPPMLPIALWFWMCSQYFPRLTREQLSFAQQVVNKLPEFGLLSSSSTALASPGINQYVPIFCLPKVVQTLSSAGLSTLVAPIHTLLSKQYKSPAEASTSQSKKNSRGGAPNSNRTLLTTSLQEYLEDKRNEKKFRLQYTVADDMFLSQLRAAVLRIENKATRVDSDPRVAGSTQTPIDKIKVLKERGHTPLEDVIQKMQEELAEQSQQTQNCLKALHRKIEADRNNQLFFEGTFKSDHLLQDIQSSFKDEMLFLDIMEYKQQNQVTCSILDSQERRNKYSFPEKERPKKSEDYVCQICNDGDYSDENQIVFCSRCNISFHQRCYGIPQIPQGNWICDLCRYHGPEGRLIRCALCTRRGGCLRRTYIPARDEFWKVRNKAYWEFCSEGSHVDPSEPPAIYSKDGQTSLIDDDVSVNSENFEEFLYYDYYQELDKWRMGDEQLEPKTHLAWVHLSCCMWISDLEMTLEPAPHKVKNLENLDKLRFNLECGICGKKEGACIQCHNRNCAESFHVECARRTKMFMEARNSENRFFTIYCEKHAPLEAKRKLESSAANNCNLITKFCRNVEKLFESYRPRCIEKPIEEETPAYIRQLKKRIAERQQSGRQQNGGDDELFSNPFIKTVRFEVQKYPDYGNLIEIKLDPETGECLSAGYSPPTSSIWKDLICKTHPVWEQLSKAHDWYQPLVYKKYKRLMNGSDELPFDHLVKVKIPRSQRNKRRNADYDSDEISYIAEDGIYFIENTEKFDNELYCICQRPWNGELMTECLKCIKWFHPKCLGIEETDEVKLNQMDIVCQNCSGKFQEVYNDHNQEDLGPCLGKRGSQDSLDEENINNLQENHNHDFQPEAPQDPVKLAESGEREVAANVEFRTITSPAAEPTREIHDLKNGHSSEAIGVAANDTLHIRNVPLGLENPQIAHIGVSQPVPEKREYMEIMGLKKTPSTKQEALFSEAGKKSSTRSPLSQTPTKQHNITQYFPVLSKSPAKTLPEPAEGTQDRQEQS